MASELQLQLQQQRELQMGREWRRQPLQQMVACRGQPLEQSLRVRNMSMGNIDGDYLGNPPTIVKFDPVLDDIPVDPSDYDDLDREDAFIPTFNAACRHGPLSAVQSIISWPNPPPTRFFLHHGLVVALRAGNIDSTRYLLSVGTPIVRRTAENVLAAPSEKQLPLFDLLFKYGWKANTPSYYGAVLLPRVVKNLPLLEWFLDHGANPNLGKQRYNQSITSDSRTDSCAALERAAYDGNFEAARLLLNASAVIQNGIPLHAVAGRCPKGLNPWNDRVRPSKEFDQSSIPVMALLVERGADVNLMDNDHNMVPRYAIVKAIMAGAVERVKWLLEHRADPELGESKISAVSHLGYWASEEMRHVFDERMNAEK